MAKKDAIKIVSEFVIITVVSFLAAAAIYFFMIPSKVVVGTVSALAMVLANFVPLSVSAITLIINLVLLGLGFWLIGMEFGAKTVYTTIIVPVALGVYEILFPNVKSLTNDPLIDILCYTLIAGMSIAIMFSLNASSGGLDILAKIMNKYLKIEFGRASAIAGLLVAMTSVFCYDTKTIVLSLLSTYFGGLIIDYFIFGLNIKRRVCIMSDKSEEIIDFILKELHSGATLYDAVGAYEKKHRCEILTIVNKQEYRLLMNFIKKVDPNAFVTVYSVSEVRYRPKTI
ncbi:MAG: YitT family protein [Clostridia bacterium]|nr:YitT family protein [Clostridia bacterium]